MLIYSFDNHNANVKMNVNKTHSNIIFRCCSIYLTNLSELVVINTAHMEVLPRDVS